MRDRKLARSAPQGGAGPKKPRDFGEIVSIGIDFSKVNLTILANRKTEEGNKPLFLLIKFLDQKKRHSYFEGTEQESAAPPEACKMGPGKFEILAMSSLIQKLRKGKR